MQMLSANCWNSDCSILCTKWVDSHKQLNALSAAHMSPHILCTKCCSQSFSNLLKAFALNVLAELHITFTWIADAAGCFVCGGMADRLTFMSIQEACFCCKHFRQMKKLHKSNFDQTWTTSWHEIWARRIRDQWISYLKCSLTWGVWQPHLAQMFWVHDVQKQTKLRWKFVLKLGVWLRRGRVEGWDRKFMFSFHKQRYVCREKRLIQNLSVCLTAFHWWMTIRPSATARNRNDNNSQNSLRRSEKKIRKNRGMTHCRTA